jgi:signal transduction histidine kinase
MVFSLFIIHGQHRMSATTPHKNTILVVDDIPNNVSVLFSFLSKTGFKVLVAQDGKRALQTAEQARPDLILLDVMMPGMDGFEVCRILKSQETTKDIPVIFMTALVDTIDKIKGFQLGAADYLSKPVQHEEVLARITAHLKVRKLQQQLEEKNQQLQAQTVELEKRHLESEAFARTVAHDLKNPLSGIIGLTNLLLTDCTADTLPTADSIENLQFIAQAADKMLNIIDALLLLANASKQKNINTQALDMSHIIIQVTNHRLAYMFKEFHGKVKLPETWPVAKGYAPWVEEIWANYISNALKYGGQPPHIELDATTQADGMIRFWVRDNGPGLSPESQAQLFTPFTRLHQDRAEGHGLGLSIVQQVVERLGGEAGVESTLGEGSIFYFTLPAMDE